jgi:hypothetical protein
MRSLTKPPCLFIFYVTSDGKPTGLLLTQVAERSGVYCCKQIRDCEKHVSTASRVLTQTDCQYSVAEQDMLAIVFALHKHRIYIFGYESYMHSDNKALSFLGKCALTSNRIARWVMQIQEYNPHIQHIRGADNFLADTISRNPAFL